MSSPLSPDTQAILLLTAPLIAGRGTSSPELLSPGEYKRLVLYLVSVKRRPADLLSSESADLLRECRSVVDEARLKRLLGRGFLLAQVVERWQSRAIWVISRADAEYPRRLKDRLREDAPAVIYGCGDRSLLDTGGLAVVGSRHAEKSSIDYATAVGRLAAQAGRTIVSGGAKGVDQAVMTGASDAGGSVIGVLADSLEKSILTRENRNRLLNTPLVLISPYDPSAGFRPGLAMQRNKLIYALADASLVVASDLNTGGTWNGAVQQIEKLKFVPVYVRSTGEMSPGLEALRRKGAIPWPNPTDTDALETVFDVKTPTLPPRGQSNLALLPGFESPTTPMISDTTYKIEAESKPMLPSAPPALSNERGKPRPSSALTPEASPESDSPVATVESTPADALFATVREVVQSLLKAPMNEADLATALAVSNAQAKKWLQRLVEEGVVEKQKKPVGYVVKQSRLF
jgi:DNA processing protein